MSILKYKDPKTGEFKRINPYKADLSFVGKDGIVVNKAPNSETVEISGSGLVQIPSPAPTYWAVLVYEPGQKKYTTYPMEINPRRLSVPYRDYDKMNFKVGDLTTDDDGQYCANKKYVDAADKDLRLKLSNLEQALNGYILDTTKEAYADLDSAVLKNSVAVGDNVYPIADKTRALVSRIEGKTTKMVQLLDKSKFPATQTANGVTFTNNGDGTITVNGTVTQDNHAYILIQAGIECIANHKYLIMGCPEGGLAGRIYGISIQSLEKPIVWDEGKGNIFSFDSHTTISLYLDFYINNATYTNKVVTPQLFDLTAMNREDITSAEQFKAEFPELYPYENGNIYPAKISGVKFTGKNLFNINQFERYNPTDTADAKVINDKLLITGYPVNLPNNHYFSNLIRSLKPNTQYAISVNISDYISDASGDIAFIGKNGVTVKDFHFYQNGYNSAVFSLTQEDIDTFDYVRIYGNLETKPPLIMTNLQIEENSAATAYEPYIEPVSVTLPETYDLHGIGDNKDYLEITKNENNELYTLKKVQSVEVNESENTITPLTTPVETVIATNLTYEQVTAIRHNGGLIEVVGNTNKAYVKPTVTNTIVYRLTATNTAEG